MLSWLISLKCFGLFCLFVDFSGKSLAALRERVERQRSVGSNMTGSTNSNSLEGLNLERGGENSKPAENLDNQAVSTLHQDVAQLSAEVHLN